MNCLDFVRQANGDPQHLGTDAQDHLKQCRSCQQQLESLRDFDQRLRERLSIPAPQGLEERIILRRRIERRRWTQRWAIAATVTGLFIGAGLIGESVIPPSMAARMAEHVQAEAVMFTMQGSADEASVIARIATIGATIRDHLPAVVVEPCTVPGGNGAHIVLATSAGNVVMTTIPNRDALMPREVERDGLISVTQRAEHGQLSLVAQNRQALEEAERILADQLIWQS